MSKRTKRTTGKATKATSTPQAATAASERRPPLRLEYRRAGDLTPNPANWRTHPPEQVEAVRAVINDVGYAGAALFNERTGRLIDGHLRRDLDPEADIPVLIGSWTDEEERKILATLDPTAGLAGMNAEAFRRLVDGMAFDSDAVKKMLAGLTEEASRLISVEAHSRLLDPESPLPPDDPVTKPGDLIILGNHRLLCGDSSKPEDVDRLLDGAKIHLVNTDPPYNVKVEPRSNNAIAAGITSFSRREDLQCERSTSERGKQDRARKRTHHQSFDVARQGEKKATTKKMRAKDRPLANDFVTDAEFDAMLLAWFGNISRVLIPGGGFYIWGGYANLGNYPPALKASGLYFSQGIVWDKQHPVLTRKDFMGAFEIAFYGWKEGAAHRFFGPNNATDLWPIKKVNPQSMVHLTEKPVELAARAIEYSSQVGENVLDLFGGSGSTMMACEQMERRAFLMELDAAYCDVIIARWEALTGRKAERKRA